MRSLTCPLLAAAAMACAGPTRSPQPSAAALEPDPSVPSTATAEPALPAPTTTPPAPAPIETETERLARLFWFTVEFGLIREDGRLKLYGSGLISSEGEGHHALYSPEVERRPFDLERVCSTSFEIHHYQPILYVLESFDQLSEAMRTYADRLLSLKRAA